MRSWKQIYAVLQGQTLTLYKDRKDALSEEDPLRVGIKACLIDISYCDTRRKNVLRLTTTDCKYLFQADSKEEMLSWIKVIQDSSNPDEEVCPFLEISLFFFMFGPLTERVNHFCKWTLTPPSVTPGNAITAAVCWFWTTNVYRCRKNEQKLKPSMLECS